MEFKIQDIPRLPNLGELVTAPFRTKVKENARKQLWESLLDVYEKEVDKENVADLEEVEIENLDVWSQTHINTSLRGLTQVAQTNPQLITSFFSDTCGSTLSTEHNNTEKLHPGQKLKRLDYLIGTKSIICKPRIEKEKSSRTKPALKRECTSAEDSRNNIKKSKKYQDPSVNKSKINQKIPINNTYILQNSTTNNISNKCQGNMIKPIYKRTKITLEKKEDNKKLSISSNKSQKSYTYSHQKLLKDTINKIPNKPFQNSQSKIKEKSKSNTSDITSIIKKSVKHQENNIKKIQKATSSNEVRKRRKPNTTESLTTSISTQSQEQPENNIKKIQIFTTSNDIGKKMERNDESSIIITNISKLQYRPRNDLKILRKVQGAIKKRKKNGDALDIITTSNENSQNNTLKNTKNKPSKESLHSKVINKAGKNTKDLTFKTKQTRLCNTKYNNTNHKCTIKLLHYSSYKGETTRPDGRVFSCKLIFKLSECCESDEVF